MSLLWIGYQFFQVGLIFSKNALEDLKSYISNIFNVPVLEKSGNYLGLPSEWCQSKKQTLGLICDGICSKLSSWKENLLSLAGKEVLLKLVVHVTPERGSA